MVNYKLTYFAARGRAELIRLIFHAGGVKFVDERIEGKDWPALKPKIPHGALPALEMDGQVFGQSIAIARYVARQVGLAGKTPIEEFRADELVDTVTDFGQAYIKVRFEKDEAKKAELKKDFQANTVPNFISKLSNLLKSSGDFFIGKSHFNPARNVVDCGEMRLKLASTGEITGVAVMGLTWADLAVFNTLDMLSLENANALDKAPELKAFKKRIESLPNLSSYLKARPASDF